MALVQGNREGEGDISSGIRQPGSTPSCLLVPVRLKVTLGQWQRYNDPGRAAGMVHFAPCCLYLFIRTSFSSSWLLQEWCEVEGGKHRVCGPAQRRREQKLEDTPRTHVLDPKADGVRQRVHIRTSAEAGR